MRLRELSGEQRAVGPIISAAIAVVLTIILATVVTMVVLGVGEVEGDGPSAEFEMSYDGSANASTMDSFGNTGGSFDGILTVRYVEGDSIQAGELLLTGVSSEQGRAPFAPDGGYAIEEAVQAGDTIRIWVDSDNEVEVLWDDLDDGGESVLGTWSGA